MLEAAEHVLYPNQNEPLARDPRRNHQSAEKVLGAVNDLDHGPHIALGGENAKADRAVEAVHALHDPHPL